MDSFFITTSSAHHTTPSCIHVHRASCLNKIKLHVVHCFLHVLIAARKTLLSWKQSVFEDHLHMTLKTQCVSIAHCARTTGSPNICHNTSSDAKSKAESFRCQRSTASMYEVKPRWSTDTGHIGRHVARASKHKHTHARCTPTGATVCSAPRTQAIAVRSNSNCMDHTVEHQPITIRHNVTPPCDINLNCSWFTPTIPKPFESNHST